MPHHRKLQRPASRVSVTTGGPLALPAPSPIGRRFAALTAAGSEGEAERIVDRLLQAALADDADALGEAAAEACTDVALAGAVIVVLARLVVAAAHRDEGR